MTAYVGLLRAINVGGRKPVAMRALRSLVEGLGYRGVVSILQSGNVIFHSSERQKRARIEADLEREAVRGLDLQSDIMVRNASEWTGIIDGNPFGTEARKDPSHLVVMCLKGEAAEVDVRALQESIAGPEQVRGWGSHLYITYPAGIGRSKLTNAAIEKRIGTRGTARNWNTVMRIAEGLQS